MKTISLVGRPNVGKSSIFNLLTKSRSAIVSDLPGLTRDRHYSKIFIDDSPYLLIDTGGLDQTKKENISAKIADQTLLAIDESDLIFFVVDARSGCLPADHEISLLLRKKNKPILLLINKSEGIENSYLLNEFNSLGFNQTLCISASHNEGLNLVSDYLILHKSINLEFNDNQNIKLAIVGKPNVGKSTLINSLIGEERFISYDMPGTTRDSVATFFNFNNHEISIIDTAGIRKKGRVIDKVEKFSILKSILSIEQSDICILVVDANEGLSSQDLQIFGYIIDSGKPLVISVNKWDLLDNYKKEIFKKSLSKKINFFRHYEIFYISALKKIGLNKLILSALNALKSSRKKIKTSVLNRLISDLQIAHQPPIIRGIRPKLKYIHQGEKSPPTFIIHGNHLQELKKDYIRFIEASLIKTFNFVGTPLKIELKESENPFEPQEKMKKKTGLVTRRKVINKKRDEIKRKKRL